MSWIHFLLWITGAYGLYYLVNILYDLSFGGQNVAVKATANELSFMETHQPQRLEHGTAAEAPAVKPVETSGSSVTSKPKKEPEIIESRGVTLKNLFNLAREESIIYTKAVSFQP